MRTTGTKVRLLAWLIGIALVGLAVVQIVLLRKALETENEAFRRTAVVALSKAAEAISTGEILRVAVSGLVDPVTGNPPTPAQVDSIINDLRGSLSVGRPAVYFFGDDSSVTISYGDSSASGDSTGHRMIQVEVRTDDDEISQAETGKTRETRELRVLQADSARYMTDMIKNCAPESATVVTRWHSRSGFLNLQGQADTNRAIMVTAALNLLDERELIPIGERIDTLKLDSALAGALQSEGINLEYEFGIVDAAHNSVVMLKGTVDSGVISASPYRTRLFPYDVMSRPNDLVVYFPAKRSYVWKQLVPVAFSAGLLLLMIATALAYTMRVIIGQEKFAVRLTDFINNMTHEFKTPISTIHLASQALDQEEVVSDGERIQRFNRVIRDENRRMKIHVEKILQLAVIEEGGVEIKREPIDLHEIVKKALDAVRLNVSTRGGEVESRLEADRSVVDGDELHLYNVAVNLLDNACKYSSGAPMIQVATENHGTFVRLRVADRGIGIAEEDRRHVFDKYFRVPTGDRHDVKGFGLGLSYVRLVVEACGGKISLNSALGKGTEVTVELHLSEKDD